MMGDMLQWGFAKQSEWLKASASQTVTYTRGNASVEILATYGRKPLKIDDGMGGIRLEWTDMSFTFPAADFHFAYGDTIEPQRGDLVTMTISGQAQTFEVLPFGSEPCWRWDNGYQIRLFVHTKHIDTEQFYR